MSETGAWHPSMESLIRESLVQRWRVEFSVWTAGAWGPVIPLDAEECTVTLDEDWWPYVQGTVVIAAPEDQATFDALDPRRLVRCRAFAGYVLPNGVEDVHQLAEMYLVDRTVERPSNRVTLSVQGAEYLFGRVRCFSQNEIPGFTWNSQTPARVAVNSCLYGSGYKLGWYLNESTWDYVNASEATGWAGDYWWDGTEWVDDTMSAASFERGYVPIEVAQEVANRCGVWFRCDEAGIWHLGDYTIVTSAVSSHLLAVGENGTILDAATTMNRATSEVTAWANVVLMPVTWGTDQSYVGQAWVSAGPFSIDQTPIVGSVIPRVANAYASAAAFDAMAASLLRRCLAKGRGIDLSAIAAYWLRPTQTVTVQLPIGPQERHLVRAVEFSLHEGTMQVSTKNPDTVSTISTGG